MIFGQDQGSFLLQLTNFRKMGNCARNSPEIYLTLVVGEIVLQSHFELPEMYMLDTFLQFGLLMRTRVIPSGLPEHSQLRIPIRVIRIVFRYSIGYHPSLNM